MPPHLRSPLRREVGEWGERDVSRASTLAVVHSTQPRLRERSRVPLIPDGVQRAASGGRAAQRLGSGGGGSELR